MTSLKTILMALTLATASAALAQTTAPSTTPLPAGAPATAESPVSPGTASVGAPASQAVTATTDATPVSADAPAATPADAPAATTETPIFHTPEAGIGMPDGRLGLQDQFTAIGEEAAWMHNAVLMPIITVISLLVLALLLWVVVRYRRAANPVPSRTSHNTVIEVIWTLVPVLILVVIAVPSIKLLAAQYSPPKPDLTVKVIGHQWYWSYQYPDNGDFEVVSNMLKEKSDVKPGDRYRTDADGPRLLAADEHLVVPAGAVVKLIVTSDDVIHSFAVPAFWTKMDAVPGRLNETWIKVDRPGIYYGQCSELCGARHGFMPIAVEVVSRPQFAQWVASKGGTIGGAATAADATAVSPVSNPTAGNGGADAAGAPATAPAGATLVNATAAAAPTAQAATGNTGN